jgi:uncharacterized membrane protein
VVNPRRVISFLAVLLIASAPWVLAQGTYTQMDVPGSFATANSGINAAGHISGCYSDTNADLHGFLFVGGTYTTIDYPGMPSGTCMQGLNDSDQVVGEQEFSPFPNFIYDASAQTFTDVNCPPFTNSVGGINNAGVVAGSISVGQTVVGLLTKGSTCKDVAPQGAPNTYLLGISDNEKAAGWVRNPQGVILYNFLYSHGKYHKFHIPNATNVTVLGINPAGNAIVGYYNPSADVTAGFIYQNNTLTTLQFPGFNYTFVQGINSAGVVVGTFSDTGIVGHGFIWTPPADPVKK